MQLFLFLNDLAGRFSPLDQAMRFFYVAAVPSLATLFLAGLLVLPRRPDAPARARVAAAVGLALLLAVFIGLAFEYLAQLLRLGVISPRPFMTRRVNLLVVEPQDNSFPCFELTAAAIFALGIAFSNRKWGLWAGGLTVLLGVARLYCGTNYLADVVVGALLGVGAAALCGAVLNVRLRMFEFKPAWQLGFSTGLLALTLGGTYVSLASTPRFASKLPMFWGSPATADTSDPVAHVEPHTATRAARTVLQEGEGVVHDHSEASHSAEPSAEELALSKRSHLFLPEVEKYLEGKLTPLTRPFRLLDVEVAPVKVDNIAYRCAAIRFEVVRTRPHLRRETAEVAARLVKSAFAFDSQLQNVDVTAVLIGDAKEIDGSEVRFAGDEVPVFTASIQRKNLVVAQPRWANDPKLDGGSWLRTRSRLYVNAKILPPTAATKPTPRPTPVPTPRIALPIKPIRPKAVPAPTPLRVAPMPTTAPTVGPTVRPTRPRPMPAPQRVKPKPTAAPTLAKPTTAPIATLPPAAPSPTATQASPAPVLPPAVPQPLPTQSVAPAVKNPVTGGATSTPTAKPAPVVQKPVAVRPVAKKAIVTKRAVAKPTWSKSRYRKRTRVTAPRKRYVKRTKRIRRAR